MEKTKDQLLMEKLRRITHRLRGGHRIDGSGRWSAWDPQAFVGRDPHRGPHGEVFGLGGRDNPRGCPPGDPRERRGHVAPPCPPPPMYTPMFHRERILLIVLEAGENGLRQKDIAEKLGINASSLSEQIDRLESDRYLERRVNPDDRRSTLITLTAKGKARAYEVTDEQQKKSGEFFSRLTEEEKDTLIALLDKLLDVPNSDD